MSVRKFISQRHGKVKWYVMVQSEQMNGFHNGDAGSIAEAESKIDNCQSALNFDPPSASNFDPPPAVIFSY